MDALLLAARLILAAVCVVSGISKLFDLTGSQAAMRSFGVQERFTRAGGIALPIVEIVIAVLLVPAATARWGALLGLILLAIFVAGISYSLSRGRKFDCHCFGQLTSSEIGPSTLIRNAILAVLAAFVTISGFANNDPGPGLTDVFRGLDAFEWLMLAVAVILLAATAAIGWLLVHLLGQNGRLLVRLDRIEAALADADIEIAEDDEDDEDDEEEGLAFGAPAPAFSLSGLYGETMTLDSLRAAEKPVLLIFTDPGCGPCNAMMGDVGKWQRDLAEKLTIAVISRGSLEDNRNKAKQHNLTHVLMQKDNEVADAYQTYGTPTAVLVRPDGTIGSAAAGGAQQIHTLVKQAAEGKVPVPKPRLAALPRPTQARRPAANAQAPRGIASIGKDAPVVELSNLDGEPVKLADFAGHPTAVLFWNPGCGFCQRMLDDLKSWESDKPEGAPNLLVVSTGEVERNREQGLSSPVVLDSGFNVGRAFGASGTPSAVLVGADGKIASGLAVGGPTVISLLRNEAPNLLDPSAADEGHPEGRAPASPRGIGVGGKAPTVQLPDLDGKAVNLDEIRNGRTALLFWNPGCGFCQRLVEDIKRWEKDRPEGAPQLLLISTGDPDANRQHGFESTILLDQGFRTGEAFGASGTPSAILIDAEGNVASGLSVGGPDVMNLLRS
jgi:peroxiredoxin